MSYYNYVEVEEREYENLKKRAKEASNLKRRLNEERKKRKRDKRNFEKSINKVRDELKKENKKLRSELSSLNEELFSTKRELKREIDFLETNLKTEISNLREETKIELEKHSKKIDKIVRNINLEKENKKNIALTWLNNLNAQIDMIKKLNHQKFAPNELNELLTQIELAKTNIDQGVYEAAISSLQERYIEASKLFNKVYLLQEEFDNLKNLALNLVDELLILLETQREVEYEISGKKVTIDVNYWSDNRLDELQESIKLLQSEINDENTTTERMIKIISELENIKEELKLISDYAKDKFILAESRISIANKTIDVLEELGFEAVEDTFDRDDKRKSVFVKFENEAEEEIIVVVSPQNNLNKMSIMFDVNNTNEKFKDIRLQKMLQKLRNEGIEVNNFECADSRLPKEHINQFKDFEKIKRGEVETKNI